jgi:hypothetical protein
MIRLISFRRCSSVSNGFNSRDMLRGDQKVKPSFFDNSPYSRSRGSMQEEAGPQTSGSLESIK